MKQMAITKNQLGLFRTAIILLFAWSCATTMNAQDDVTQKMMDNYAQMKQDKEELGKQNKELKQKLENAYARHQEELDKKDRQIKDTVKVLNDTIGRKNKQLKELSKQLRKSSRAEVDMLNKRVDSLVVERDRLKDVIERLQRQQHLSDSTLAVRTVELRELAPFRELQLKQTLEKAREWASLPFSSLDQQEMAKVITDCKRYGGNNADFKEAAQGLEALTADLYQFDNARKLLTLPFNEPKKNAARQQLKALKAKYNGKEQYQELDEVDVLLRGYRGGVIIFKNLIEKLNGELEDGGRSNNNSLVAQNTLEQVLEEQQQNIREIEKVPYLKQRLSEYIAALKKDPLRHWGGESEIKEMLK